MEKTKYKDIVDKNKPKENVLLNALIAFLIGGFMGIIGQLLIELYSSVFDIASKEASILMIVTLVFLGCLFTSLGFFDKWVNFAKCGLIVPITGFAHAMMSAALEYRKEGLVTGIGSNMLKLSGSVIIFGVVSAYTFGIIRYILFLYILQRFSVLYMALMFFVFGPFFDFLYLVGIYSIFMNKMIELYESQAGKDEWLWS